MKVAWDVTFGELSCANCVSGRLERERGGGDYLLVSQPSLIDQPKDTQKAKKRVLKVVAFLVDKDVSLRKDLEKCECRPFSGLTVTTLEKNRDSLVFRGGGETGES
jgi:hypothetical protein